MSTLNELINVLNANFYEIVETRRYLHQHPELSFEEVNTSQYIAGKLRNLGIEVCEEIGGLGVVGIIHGSLPGPMIGLRADFDALPINDNKDVEYKSKVPGVMHACGHDGHTAALLAVTKILSKHKHLLKGSVKVIFQHAEEKPPGGAKSMIDAGVLSDVDYIFGAHLETGLKIGTLATGPGAIMASVDAFKVKLFGKGGHGAKPHETNDTIIGLTQLVQHLQQIVSRRIDPIQPAVLTIGSLHAGHAFNVIADTAELEGTVRTLDESVRTIIEKEIRAILDGLKVSNHLDYQLDYQRGYPVLVNHAHEALIVETLINDNFDAGSFVRKEPALVAEDFAYYLRERPGAFFYVGAHNDHLGTQFPHHHPNFDFDERALLNIGTVFLSIIDHYLISSKEDAQ